MGSYVEADDKSLWLAQNGRFYGFTPPPWGSIDVEAELPVCLVDNGHFLAAAIATSQAEMYRFDDPRDDRPKEWYVVPRERLNQFIQPGVRVG